MINKVNFNVILLVVITFVILKPCYALQWPSPSSSVTSGYGYRIHPVKRIPKWHNGIDISTGGTSKPLKAVASGTIERIASGGDAGGNRITATGWQYMHLANTQTNWEFGVDRNKNKYFAIQLDDINMYYSRNAELLLTNGRRVAANTRISEGQYFAYSGNTGAGTGIHLHLINYNGGDPTKHPLTDLYSANNKDQNGYNPPRNANDPTVSSLNYDKVSGIISGRITSANEKDINLMSLSINGNTAHDISFSPRRNAQDKNISKGTKTGLRPLDTDSNSFDFYYKWSKSKKCRDSEPDYKISLLATDAGGKSGSASIMVEPVAPYNYPGCDHPDDNFSVSDSLDLPPDEEYFGDPIWTNPNIGILKDGFVAEMGDILNQNQIFHTITDIDLSTLKADETKLTIIPSGGLHAL